MAGRLLRAYPILGDLHVVLVVMAHLNPGPNPKPWVAG